MFIQDLCNILGEHGSYLNTDLSLKKRRNPKATNLKTDSRTKMRVKM